MGVDAASLRFLILSSQTGVSFERTLTLGRQNLHCASWELELARKDLGVPRSDLDSMTSDAPFADSLYRYLGAQEVQSMDASPYEDATLVHSLNDPVPQDLHGRFSVVHDGGTLEHVFDVRTAWSNAMQMVKEGGHLLSVSTANNHLGHGFYQFSPELLFRMFSPENGFEMEGLFLYEQASKGFDQYEVYEVRDPADLRRRALLVNSHSTLLLLRARRIANVAPFSIAPTQSDYAATWEVSNPSEPLGKGSTSGMRDIRYALRRQFRFIDRIRHGISASKPPSKFDQEAYTRWRLDASMRSRWLS